MSDDILGTSWDQCRSISLRPRKPEGSLGRTAQDGHLDSHTTRELCHLLHWTASKLCECLGGHGLHTVSAVFSTSLQLSSSGRTLCQLQSLFLENASLPGYWLFLENDFLPGYWPFLKKHSSWKMTSPSSWMLCWSIGFGAVYACIYMSNQTLMMHSGSHSYPQLSGSLDCWKMQLTDCLRITGRAWVLDPSSFCWGKQKSRRVDPYDLSIKQC